MGRETNKQRRERQAETAREKAAAARAVQHRQDQRRRAITILSSVVGVAVVGALIAVLAITSGGGNNPNGDRTDAQDSIVTAVTSVPAATLNSVGQGSAQLIAKPISDAPLTKNGKPQVLFIGGEFCPFCAAERWSLVSALSRFGTFSNLKQIRSATNDGNLATFSFYKSSYASKYVDFEPIEYEDRAGNKLEPVTKQQEAIWTKYTSGFPFLDFGGKYVQTNSGFTDTDLSGLNWTQIANALKDPSSTVAKDILGESNVITATICKLTNNQPASVCQAKAITDLQSQIGA